MLDIGLDSKLSLLTNGLLRTVFLNEILKVGEVLFNIT